MKPDNVKFTSVKQEGGKRNHQRSRSIKDEGIGKTHKPCPEALHLVAGRGLVVRAVLDLLQAGYEVHVRGVDRRAPVVQPRRDVEHREEDEREIVRDERVRSPAVLQEDVEARELCNIIN